MSTQDFKAKLASTGQRPIFHQQDYLSLMCELLISIDEKLEQHPPQVTIENWEAGSW